MTAGHGAAAGPRRGGLRVSGLSKVHGSRGAAVTALRGLDLAVEPGEVLAVLGPSGSGKSTLLRLVAGLDRASAGSISIAGRDVTRVPPGQRDVAMVFQTYALFPHLTTLDNISFGLEVRDMPRREARARALQAAALVGCAELADRRPGQLSGGERQRVALARALVREPQIFLLDEPLSNLDTELRVAMRGELADLQRRVGATTLHVTHDQAEALALGDRVAVLRDGQLEQLGTPEELWTAPVNRFVARFIGTPAMNLLPVPDPARPPLQDPGLLEDLLDEPLADRPVEFGVRPDALRLVTPGTWGSTPARVIRVERVGADAHVHLQLAGPHAVTLVARVPAELRPAPDDAAAVQVRRADLHVFDAATGRGLRVHRRDGRRLEAG